LDRDHHDAGMVEAGNPQVHRQMLRQIQQRTAAAIKRVGSADRSDVSDPSHS